MLNGLYKVQFSTPIGSGWGLIHAIDGRIWGGDPILFYTGTFREEDGALTAEIRTDRHTSIPGTGSVFGTDRVTINLTGRVLGTKVVCAGTSPNAPGLKFEAVLEKISD